MVPNKLRILVLKHLGHGAHSGYQLTKEIHEQTGWKPSYGSIYPLLEQMKREGLVTFKEEGKKKSYSLTAKGKTAYEEFQTHHEQIARQMREIHNVMSELCNVEKEPFFEYIATQIEKGEVPFNELVKTGQHFRAELARLANDGLLKERRGDVIAILEDATQKLRRIKKKEGRTRAKDDRRSR